MNHLLHIVPVPSTKDQKTSFGILTFSTIVVDKELKYPGQSYLVEMVMVM